MGLWQSMGQQFSAAWGRLSMGHRVILLLLCAVCIGGLVAVASWASTPQYEVLSAGLNAKDCATLVSALKDAGVPARLAEGGAVMVPAGKMSEARMAAAEKGVPSNLSQGFDTFQNPKIGMTPFAERINYISALQNELATTIGSLDSVSYARVHLVVPEQSLFKKDQKQATASVLVGMRNGESLSARSATAIANLVASAVPGLSPQDVTITDGHGNVLAGGRQNGPETAADDQWTYRRTVEADLAQKAETMLTRALGPGRCEVRVSAEMTFEDTRETKRAYDPETRVIVSESLESSKTTGSGMQVGGTAGAAGNIPSQGQPASATASPNTSTTENVDTRYLVGESVKETVNRGATIKRLSVAAMVDLTAPPAKEGADAKTQPAMPTPEDIQRIVEDAVGFDTKRGDSLKIVQANFHSPEAEAQAQAGSFQLMPFITSTGQYFAIAGLALVLLVVARRLMKNIESAAPRPVIVPELMEADGSGRPQGELSQDEMMRREIARIVGSDPKSASRLLEGWIEEEE
jgi:flagellar M-ring protein FliF